MNRIKERLRVAEKLKRQPEKPLRILHPDESPPMPPGCQRVFANNRYVVFIFERTMTTHGYATRALIQTVDDKPIQNHWSELQKIKNFLFSPETVAIEYYPRQSKLVDEHNIYWLWVFPGDTIPEMI